MAHAVTAATSIAYLLLANVLWYGFARQSGPALPVVIFAAGLAIALLAWAVTTRGDGRWPGPRALTVLLSGSALLAVFWLFGRRDGFSRVFGSPGYEGPHAPLLPFYYVVATSVLFRLLLPLGCAKLLLGAEARDFGYRSGRGKARWWLYATLAVGGAGLALVASTQPAFVRAYPRCANAIVEGELSLSVFVVYQFAYLLFFVSGESFWRGYLLFGLEPQFGRSAVFLSTIPYAVLHFGKPQLESLGAIAAGVLLGYLALWHRSFWAGVAVHYCVALSMDLAALWQRGVRLVL